MKTGAHHTDRFIPGYRSSAGRAVVSFEYQGQPIDKLPRGPIQEEN
jgi:hypothetical protein